MGLVRDLYIEEFERIVAEWEERGMSRERAEKLAGDRAYDAMRDRMFDMADLAKKRMRGE